MIPESVTNIQWGAFANCTRLSDAQFLSSSVKFGYINNAGMHAFEGCALDLSTFIQTYPMLSQDDLVHFYGQRPKVHFSMNSETDTIRQGTSWSPPAYHLKTKTGVLYSDLVTGGDSWISEGLQMPTVTTGWYDIYGNTIPVGTDIAATPGSYMVVYELDDNVYADTNRLVYTLIVTGSPIMKKDKDPDDGSGTSTPDTSTRSVAGSSSRDGAGSDKQDTDLARKSSTGVEKIINLEGTAVPLAELPEGNYNPAMGG